MITGLLTEKEATEAKMAVQRLRRRDTDRFAAVRAAFDDEGESDES